MDIIPQRKLLTVAIPTYNRKIYLQECLEHLLPQVDDDVELLVCDNASTDGTDVLMASYCGQYPFILYKRRANNMGADWNVLHCLLEAKGEYVQLLCDDDVIMPGSITAIKNCLQHHQPLSYIHLNLCSFSDKFSPETCTKPLYNLSEDLYFTDKNMLLEFMGIYLTFASVMVLNRNTLAYIEHPEQYLGTDLPQSHLVLRCLGCCPQAAVLSHVCIAGRRANSGGYSVIKVFAYEWKRLLFDTGIKCGFAKSTLKKIFKQTLANDLFYRLMSLKTDRQQDVRKDAQQYLQQYRKKAGQKASTETSAKAAAGKWLLIRATWEYPWAWFYLYPLILLPGWLIKSYRDTKRLLQRLRAGCKQIG